MPEETTTSLTDWQQCLWSYDLMELHKYV